MFLKVLLLSDVLAIFGGCQLAISQSRVLENVRFFRCSDYFGPTWILAVKPILCSTILVNPTGFIVLNRLGSDIGYICQVGRGCSIHFKATISKENIIPVLATFQGFRFVQDTDSKSQFKVQGILDPLLHAPRESMTLGKATINNFDVWHPDESVVAHHPDGDPLNNTELLIVKESQHGFFHYLTKIDYSPNSVINASVRCVSASMEKYYKLEKNYGCYSPKTLEECKHLHEESLFAGLTVYGRESIKKMVIDCFVKSALDIEKHQHYTNY